MGEQWEWRDTGSGPGAMQRVVGKSWYERVIDTGKLDWIWDGRLKERGYDDETLAITARVLARPCPTCDAKPGDWCQTAAGHVLDDLDKTHVTRRSPWRREHGLDL